MARHADAGRAVLAPLTLFLALQATFTMQSELRGLQADAADRAREISARIDGRLWSDRNALELLASSSFVAGRDWPRAYTQVVWAQHDHPGWKNVILTDVWTRREVWQTRSQAVASPSLPDSISTYVDAGHGRSDIGGVSRDGPGCPCVTIHAPVLEAGALRYLLTAEIGTEDFQRIVRASAPVGGVAALVDRAGRFIARSLDDKHRAGLPASLFAPRRHRPQ